jgi:hypothetical protein
MNHLRKNGNLMLVPSSQLARKKEDLLDNDLTPSCPAKLCINSSAGERTPST